MPSSPSIFRFFAVALAAVAQMLLSACAHWGRPPLWPRREPPPTVESLLAPLRARAQPVRTLWLRANATVSRTGRPGKAIFQATVLAQVPDRLRLRAYRNSTILVLDLLADPSGLRVCDALQKRYYASDYETLRVAGSSWAGFSAPLLIQALTVEATVLDRAAVARASRIRRHWTTFELMLELPDGRARVFFRRNDLQIASVLWQEPDGATTRITYQAIREVDGVRLPERVDVRHDASEMHLRLDVTEYKVNADFDPRAFVLQAPAGTAWLPLDKMNFSSVGKADPSE
ncbi:MAG: DUF4292 domain-containing protein [Candidatus Sumerlaeia bacterium]|nr:DUF4292 domain-containing protein [Candidatus Sumerlaeia bacterium]